ncbi:MAG: S1C family serine protease [Xanthobacteraceae bacterium]
MGRFIRLVALSSIWFAIPALAQVPPAPGAPGKANSKESTKADQLDQSAKTIAQLNASVQVWLKQGDPAKAGKFASSLLMFAGLQAEQFESAAIYALRRGDKPTALDYLGRAYGVSRMDQLDAAIDDAGRLKTWVVKPQTPGRVPLEKFDTPEVLKLVLGVPNGHEYAKYLEGVAKGDWRSAVVTDKTDQPNGPLKDALTTPLALPPWAGVRPKIPEPLKMAVLAPENLFERVAPSVYLVIANATADASGGASVFGSAVAISEDMALTNCHVVAAASDINMFENNSQSKIRAAVVHADQPSDRCILKSETKLIPISGVRRTEDLAIGARVYTIGNPAGYLNTLGEGIISGLREQDGIKLIQTTAQISPGSSGGALVDPSGALVGITSFFWKNAQNLNFAIAADEFWH